ncbi:MAG: hypothetical protein ACYCU0_07925 [Solirubrobacteraceae bacterium]
MRFVDTNVLLYAALRNEEEQAKVTRAKEILLADYAGVRVENRSATAEVRS